MRLVGYVSQKHEAITTPAAQHPLVVQGLRMMNSIRKETEVVYLLLEEIMQLTFIVISLFIELMNKKKQRKDRRASRYSMIERIPEQIK
ncbi:hypothetical protein ACS0TY_023273 [Phlomoides rotata]